MPKFSIVTISYNQAKYLLECIQSVAQQSGEWEHIIVDPGSSDGSRDIILAHEKHFSKIILDPDKGPADGLNNGFAAATGSIGYFLNADDILLPGAIQRMTDQWDRFGSTMDLLLCGAWKITESSEPIRQLIPTRPTRKSLAEGRTAIVQQGMSFRLSTFRSVGGFNAENHTCWDGELLSALISHGARYRVIHDRIAAFRLHEESISGGAGGEVLAAKYEADTARIRERYFGVKESQPMNLRREYSYWVGLMSNLPRSMKIAMHKMFPKLIKKSWLAECWPDKIIG